MKIIDLLNKIANGEEVPEKIKFGDDIYYRKTDANDGYVIDYLDIRDNSLFNFITDYKYCFIKSCLEWEIKDLEEEKKIPEKLPYYSLEKIQKAKNKDEWREERISLLEKRVEDLHIKMNELIDYLGKQSKGE